MQLPPASSFASPLAVSSNQSCCDVSLAAGQFSWGARRLVQGEEVPLFPPTTTLGDLADACSYLGHSVNYVDEDPAHGQLTGATPSESLPGPTAEKLEENGWLDLLAGLTDRR